MDFRIIKAMFQNMARTEEFDGYRLLIIIAVIIYIFAWSTIDILRMLNMMDNVFDAGIISLTLNSILFNHNLQYMEYMFGFSMLRILFSPLILIDGIAGMLVIQEIFLGIPALVIYSIAVMKTHDRMTAFLIGTSYLIYFPLAGVNYFDYHFQSFFIFFFLFGYYLFLKEKYVLSSISFFLSGSVRFPYFAFPLLFVLTLIAYEILKKGWKIKIDNWKKKYTIANLIIFSAMLLISAYLVFKSPYYLYQKKYFFGYFHISSGSIYNALFYNINHKVINLLLIFSPLLFIPLRSPKWLIFLLPFLFLSFFNNYGVYTYPYLYHTQYTAAIAPFIFLGVIEGIRIKDGEYKNFKGSKQEYKKRHLLEGIKILRKNFRKRREPIALFFAVLLFALLFQPYSPVNPYTTEPFDMNIMHPNISVYNAYIDISNLIPENNPYVIYQNELPYVDVHDRSLSCLAAFDVAYGYPLNLSYPLQNLSFTNRVDYALAYYGSSGVPFSMLNAMNSLFSRGDYGIEAAEYGFVLLAKDYHNPPVYFRGIEYNLTIQVSEMENMSVVEVPFNFIYPSMYSLTLQFYMNTIHMKNNMVEISSSGQGTYYYKPEFISNSSGNISISFNTNRFFQDGYIELFLSEMPPGTLLNVNFKEMGI